MTADLGDVKITVTKQELPAVEFGKGKGETALDECIEGHVVLLRNGVPACVAVNFHGKKSVYDSKCGPAEELTMHAENARQVHIIILIPAEKDMEAAKGN